MSPAEKRARTKKRKEIEAKIERIEYLLKNYCWNPNEKKQAENYLKTLKQMREAYASDSEIKGAN